MKFNFQSIKFKTWLYFTVFAIIILVVLFILQSLLFVPYYENQKTKQTDDFINDITDQIEKGQDLSYLNRSAYANNVCLFIFNKRGSVIYSADNIGDGCVLNQRDYPLNDNLEALRKDEKKLIREVKTNEQTQQTSLVVGKKINGNLLTYYIFVNMPIIPASSTISILQNLLIIASLIVILFAFFMSWYFSKGIADPIIEINNSADKLAQGNYQTSFDSGGYSEVKDLAKTLNLAANRLSQIDLMRKELFANVSHDLKTPLTNIVAYSELIQEVSGEDKKKRSEHLSIIQDEAKYLSNLVDDMGLMSKDGKNDLKYTYFNLSKELIHLIDVLSQRNDDKMVRFESYIEEDIIVYGDKIKILQVVRNFITNAIKYRGKKQNIIDINLTKKNNKGIIEVKDQGVGIPHDQLPYIWDRYYRVSSNFSRKQEGSGLGLSIAKSILEQHGLVYGASSEEGKGSRFYFEMEIVDGNNS